MAADPDRDLAALRVEADGLPTIQLGDSRRVRPGQWVMALGHPWGVQGAATAGVVIGMGKEWPEMPRTRHDWLVVSLHMRPGHSGGPLVDVRRPAGGHQHDDQRSGCRLGDPGARGGGIPEGSVAVGQRTQMWGPASSTAGGLEGGVTPWGQRSPSVAQPALDLTQLHAHATAPVGQRIVEAEGVLQPFLGLGKASLLEQKPTQVGRGQRILGITPELVAQPGLTGRERAIVGEDLAHVEHDIHDQVGQLLRLDALCPVANHTTATRHDHVELLHSLDQQMGRAQTP